MTSPRPVEIPLIGVNIVGHGSATPKNKMTNKDLEKLMDTSDEWILQRTGISERRVYDRENLGECSLSLGVDALRKALDSAGMTGLDLDLVVLATMTPEMGCPATSSRLAAEIGAGHVGAWDVSAACCSFVFALNSAHALVRTGQYKTVAVVGADTLTKHVRYDNSCRDTAILFGDAAGAMILQATNDENYGLIAQSMHSDGGRWKDLFIPEHVLDFPGEPDESLLGTIRMNGRAVFKFAVGTFQELIAETLEKAGVQASDVSQFVCHQSNARILESARKRFGIPQDRMLINIGTYGNTVSASVPLCYDELKRAGKIARGDLVMFIAFGGGLTWGSSLWRL
jgi:3-oxoacyl-[acyl-carrier-protein] synthase III